MRRRAYAFIALAFASLYLPSAVSPSTARIRLRPWAWIPRMSASKPATTADTISSFGETRDSLDPDDREHQRPRDEADNFAYRAMERNDINGDETRLLNGKFLPESSRLYSLIPRRPCPDAVFGRPSVSSSRPS